MPAHRTLRAEPRLRGATHSPPQSRFTATEVAVIDQPFVRGTMLRRRGWSDYESSWRFVRHLCRGLLRDFSGRSGAARHRPRPFRAKRDRAGDRRAGDRNHARAIWIRAARSCRAAQPLHSSAALRGGFRRRDRQAGARIGRGTGARHAAVAPPAIFLAIIPTGRRKPAPVGCSRCSRLR